MVEKESEQNIEITEQHLEIVVEVIEEKVKTLTEEIERESDLKVRKESAKNAVNGRNL